MSICKERKLTIQNYILGKIDKHECDYVIKTCDNFNITKNTVYRYIREMKDNGEIVEDNNKINKCKYKLNSLTYECMYSTEELLEEDKIFTNDILPCLNNPAKNDLTIWKYAFTEMMNNAIEHAQAQKIYCRVDVNRLNTQIVIVDDGIGIFNNIREYFKIEKNKDMSYDEIILELFAGKLTTDSERHSGEGIFFTSRVLDFFAIISDDKIFSHNSFDEYYLENLDKMLGEKIHGTLVIMKLENNTKKRLNDIMNRYADPERGFYKTSLPLIELFPSGNLISRSEARRLGIVLEKFNEAVLDFKEINSIGQAFAHELFIVFKKNHPEMSIVPINANQEVSDMIKRVENTAKNFNAQ